MEIDSTLITDFLAKHQLPRSVLANAAGLSRDSLDTVIYRGRCGKTTFLRLAVVIPTLREPLYQAGMAHIEGYMKRHQKHVERQNAKRRANRREEHRLARIQAAKNSIASRAW